MTLKDKKIKIRHCFFSAYQAKMVNCVSALATAQHIEAPINTNNKLQDGLKIPTRRAFINITPEVDACLKKSGIKDGLVLVNTKHI